MSIAALVGLVVLASFSIRKDAPKPAPGFAPLNYRAEFNIEPENVKAGEPANLRFDIKNERGENVRFLQYVHEKPLHLLIVSDDLQEFYHVHPELVTDYFALTEIFPNGGKYHLFADFTPPGGKQTIEHFTVDAEGKKRPRAFLIPDKNTTKIVDGLRVSMSASVGAIRAREDFLMTFSLTDEKTNQPVTDLQLYLGALAHVAVFSADLQDFIHAHPLEAGEIYDPAQGPAFHTHNPEDAAKKLVGASPSSVQVPMIFPRVGIYKLWAQFQRNGRGIAVPFVVSVAEGETNPAENKDEIPAGAIVVKVGKSGYEPARIEIKKGESVKLAFQRIDAENCGSSVVFPALGISRELPVGKTVVIEFTPSETGEIGFACAMGMYRGIVVVSN